MHQIKWFQVFLCITNNSIRHQFFVYTELIGQTILFQTIQFSINHICIHTVKMSKSSIRPIDRTLSGVTSLAQSRPGSKEYPAFPKAPLDRLSYPEHLLEESYPFAEIQSVYSTAPADWPDFWLDFTILKPLQGFFFM